MTNTPADIIRKATDILTSDNTEVKLYLAGDDAFGGVAVRWGILSGLGSLGDDATITVTNMHDSAGIGNPGHTLVNVEHVIDIMQDWHQVS